jgi:hypothetical protein
MEENIKNNDDNILGNLRTLIWSVFVGVLSFQVIAPKVWDYLHSSLGIGYLWSYWIFTFAYFLILPAFVIVWLCSNWKLIAYYLPVYKGDLTNTSKYFLYGVLIFVALLLINTLFGFFTRWSDRLFYIVLGVYSFCCLSLLVICWRSCYLHINKFSKSYSSTDGYDEKTKNARKYLIKFIMPTILVCVLFYIIAGFFIHNWMKENNKRNSKSNEIYAFEAGRRSFAFQSLNDSVIKVNNKFASIEDDAYEKQFDLSLDTLKWRKKNPQTTARDSTFEHVGLLIYLDSLRNWNNGLDTILKTLEVHPDTVTANDIKQQIPKSLQPPDSLFEDILTHKPDIEIVGKIREFLGAISGKLIKVSKSEMGIQLRAVQTKGMLMLISLFLTLLSLYVFLKIVNKTQVIFAKEDGDKSNQEESGKAANSLWLLITITVWLLVPIFKPVKNEEINLSSPYKSPTFSGMKSSPLFSDSYSSENFSSRQHDIILINHRFDTIKVQLVDEGNSKLDSVSVMNLLNTIKSEVGKVQSQVNKVQKQFRQ